MEMGGKASPNPLNKNSSNPCSIGKIIPQLRLTWDDDELDGVDWLSELEVEDGAAAAPGRVKDNSSRGHWIPRITCDNREDIEIPLLALLEELLVVLLLLDSDPFIPHSFATSACTPRAKQ